MEIPGFEILDKLGAGGMASVWKARQVSLDRIVAIKILSSKFGADPADIQNFQTEAHSAAKFKHPGLVQVYDANASKGVYYIIMEYLAGQTVGELIRVKGKLAEKQVLTIARSVAEALDYAWKRERMIHCDIKPDNIMFDADGTVKVADMGLARTIRAMKSHKLSEEIVGTPSYMSPEQARGEEDMDCRADIYSLGASLYFMVTGIEFFQDCSPQEILQKQISDTVANPADINPKLSKGLCALIEKMTAKDRRNRQPNWEAVIEDISRVKKHRAPQDPILIDGLSSVRKRSDKPAAKKSIIRTGASSTAPLSPAVPARRQSPWALIVVGGLIVVAALMIPQARQAMKLREQRQRAMRQAEALRVESEARSREAFESAQKWAASNPERYDDAAEKFRQAAAQDETGKYAPLANREIDNLRSRKQQAIDTIMDDLKTQATARVEKADFGGAAALYEGYSGLLAQETAEKRGEIAARLRQEEKQQQSDERKKVQIAERRWPEILDGVVSRLVTRGLGSAIVYCDTALQDRDMAPKHAEIEKVKALLVASSKADEKILESFKAMKGKLLNLRLNDGMHSMVINDVTSERVIAEETSYRDATKEVRTVRFFPSDLSAKDRFVRMGPDDCADTALVRGLMLMESGKGAASKRYFEMLDPVLGKPLAKYADQADGTLQDDRAEKELVSLLRQAGVSVGLYDEAAWVKAIKDRAYSYDMADKIAALLRDYRKQFGGSDFAKKAGPVIAAIEKIRGQKTVDPASERPTGDEKGEDNPGNGLTRKFTAANPGILASDVKLAADKDQNISRIEVVSFSLSSVEPLRGMKSLREVVCSPNPTDNVRDPRVAPLRDLSPLKGLGLESLCVAFTSVNDLGPLAGMPLQRLDLRNTRVGDISPLGGMNLKELKIGRTGIVNIGMLSGMPMENLDISALPVNNLAAAEAMPLKVLNASYTRIDDLSPLKGKSLNYLNVEGTRISDLEPLSGMPLSQVLLSKTKVKDLAPLRGMKLQYLTLNDTPVRDLSALEGMPLRRLEVTESRVSDLAALANMPLEYLSVAVTSVRDISVLKGMKLRYLDIRDSRVKDLTPLAGMPLVYLDCRESKVSDYTPLESLPLQSVWVDDPTDEAVRGSLRKISSLRQVNGGSWTP